MHSLHEKCIFCKMRSSTLNSRQTLSVYTHGVHSFLPQTHKWPQGILCETSPFWPYGSTMQKMLHVKTGNSRYKKITHYAKKRRVKEASHRTCASFVTHSLGLKAHWKTTEKAKTAILCARVFGVAFTKGAHHCRHQKSRKVHHIAEYHVYKESIILI